jgi:DNA repair photolyase
MTTSEIEAKSILRRFRRIDAWFVSKSGLNLYRGCSHDCAYCDGRAEKYRVEGEFGTHVQVKTNAVEVLARELVPKRAGAQPRWAGFVVLGGGVGDSYQPAEERRGLARRTLELLETLSVPVHVLTKSTLVLRDADILGRMAASGKAIVSFSLSSSDDATSAVFEPGASPPSGRLRALETLASKGIPGGIFLLPVIPRLTDTPAMVDATLRAAGSAGARWAVFGGMTLKPGRQEEHFLSVLASFRPDLVPGCRLLYPGDPWGNAAGSYGAELNRMVGDLAARQGIPPRIPRQHFAGLVHGDDLAIVLLDQAHAMLGLAGRPSRLGRAAWQLSQGKALEPQAAGFVEEVRRTGTARLYEELLSRYGTGAGSRSGGTQAHAG